VRLGIAKVQSQLPLGSGLSGHDNTSSYLPVGQLFSCSANEVHRLNIDGTIVTGDNTQSPGSLPGPYLGHVELYNQLFVPLFASEIRAL